MSVTELQEVEGRMELLVATSEHYAGILELVRSPEELYRVYPAGQWPFTLEQLQALASERSDLTVAVDGEQVIGFANLYQVTPGQAAFIGNIVVNPDQRGQGVGKALIRHMMQICEDKYQAQPHLSVFSDNVVALLMYHSLGFKPYEVEPRQNLWDETVALLHMRHEA